MDKPKLLLSRKFWLMIVDLVVSVSTYFITKYVSPEAAKDVLFLIGVMQPVVITVVVSITVQNVTDMKARAGIQEMHLSLEESKEYRQANQLEKQP